MLISFVFLFVPDGLWAQSYAKDNYPQNILHYSGKYATFAVFYSIWQNIILQKVEEMEHTTSLDETDRRILKILQQDSHLTVKELAARVHLSPSPVFERQKRLEREGYIVRYMAVVDAHRVGNGIMVLCNIRLKQHSQGLIQEFMDVVQGIDEITECYNTSGDYDFLIKVYAQDMKSYQQFMLNTLGKIDCIGSLHSIFVIDETKNTRGVPVP